MELQNALSILGITTTVSQSYDIRTAARFNNGFSAPNLHNPARTPPRILKRPVRSRGQFVQITLNHFSMMLSHRLCLLYP